MPEKYGCLVNVSKYQTKTPVGKNINNNKRTCSQCLLAPPPNITLWQFDLKEILGARRPQTFPYIIYSIF